MPVKDFTGKNDVHLVNRWFHPNMITCQACNDIIQEGDRVDPFSDNIDLPTNTSSPTETSSHS